MGISPIEGTAISANVIGGHAAALYVTSNLQSNIILGPTSFASGQLGYCNVFIGSAAAEQASNVSGNVCIGSGAGYKGSNLTQNVILGHSAGMYQTGAIQNVFVGYGAGYGTAGTTPSNNTYNVVVGASSLQSSSGNTSNVIIGASSGNTSTSNSNNFIIGNNVGPISNTQDTFSFGNSNLHNFKGTSNIFIGNGIAASQTTTSLTIAIGHNVDVSGLSNKVIIGHSNKTVFYADGATNSILFGGRDTALKMDGGSVTSNAISDYTIKLNGYVYTPYFSNVVVSSNGQLLPEVPYIFLDPTSSATRCVLTTSVSDTVQSNTYNTDIVIVNQTSNTMTICGSFYQVNKDLTADPTVTMSSNTLRTFRKMLFVNPNSANPALRYYVGYVQ